MANWRQMGPIYYPIIKTNKVPHNPQALLHHLTLYLATYIPTFRIKEITDAAI